MHPSKVANQNAALSHDEEKNRYLNNRSHEQTDQSQTANLHEDAGLQEPRAIVCSEAAEARVWKTMTRRDKSSCPSWFQPKLTIVLDQEVPELALGMT